MISIDDCKSLNDISRKMFGKANYSNREKVKKVLSENGIDWGKWLIEKKKEKEKFCIVCGKKLEHGEKKFCSHSCSAKYTNRNRRVKKYCLNCGKLLKTKRSKFCSHECHKNFESKQYIEKWKNGEVNGVRGKYSISAIIRNFLIENSGCVCQKCGWGEKNPVTNKVPLQIHHKDGDFSNNNIDNLEVLCPNCHSLTENFMRLNKNSHRDKRK